VERESAATRACVVAMDQHKVLRLKSQNFVTGFSIKHLEAVP
jgi:hypothetical protein